MTTAEPGRAGFALLLLCFFLSGLAALIYETAWTREFAFVFGTSNLAVATVLAAYMGGLAFGAAIAARFAARVRRPLLVYGVLELLIGLSALAVPWAIAGSRHLYVAIFGGLGDLPDAGGLPTALFYLACSFAILLVPTGMMGATLPLLARHAVHSQEELGRRIGILYAVNTAGAVAGVLLAAFVLLPGLGLRLTIWSAALVNLLVFGAAAALARRAPAPAHGETAQAPTASGVSRASWILPLIALSGVVSFTYEVMWTRLLAHVLGGSLYAFASMLASFLAGIALGAAFASRRASTPTAAARDFAIAQLLIGGLAVVAFDTVDAVPQLIPSLQHGGALSGALRVGAAILVLLPGAVAIGATFPLAVRVLARGRADAGPASARVYAANTLGSIVGSVAAGFVLIPALGYAGCVAACVLVNFALAGAAALLLTPPGRGLAALAAAAAAVTLIFPPETPWRILRSSALSYGAIQGDVTYFGIGRSATVLEVETRGRFELRTNGLPEATIDPPGYWHQRSILARWLGALPALARPDASRLLVVGLGGGVAVETVPRSVDSIEVVELESEVIAANRAVSERRWRDPLADPRVELRVNDARNALLLSGARFDAIVSQPSHPWSGGAAHLYTREFFELARSRLAEGGVFVQWIGLSFVDEALFRTLLATLADVFPHVRVYQPAPIGALFLASAAPLDVERTTPRALAATPEDFARLGLFEPEDVAARLVLDAQGVAALAAGAPVNRDGNNLLQSRSPRVLHRSLAGGLEALAAEWDPWVGALPPGADPFYLLARMRPERARRVASALPDPFDRRVGRALVGLDQPAPPRLRELLAERPGHAATRAFLLLFEADDPQLDPAELLPEPLEPWVAAVAAGWRARASGATGELRALEATLAATPSKHPLAPEADALRAEWRIESGDAALAREAVALADRWLADGPAVRELLLRARASAAAGETGAALDALDVMVQNLDPRNPATARRAADALGLVRALAPSAPVEGFRAELEARLAALAR